jgi:uncharacterized membrane protein
VGHKRAEHSLVVEAPPQACFDALVDYETFPEWQQAVSSVEVVSRYPDGLGREVAFEIDAKVRRVSYRLEYSYDEPHLITWDYLGGDIKDVDGEFVLDDRGDGTTLARYAVALDAGVWLPGPVAKVLNGQVMKRSVEDLKRRVESM